MNPFYAGQLVFIKDGYLLCELPEWGSNYTRCEWTGINGHCLKYKTPEPLSTWDGWLVRCPECASGGYKARQSPPWFLEGWAEEAAAPPKNKRSAFDYKDVVKVAGENPEPRKLLLAMLGIAKRPVTKTELLNIAGSPWYPGYPSGGYIGIRVKLQEAFASLVASGDLVWERGKPVRRATDAQNPD
jgi:hypothetical protein